MVRVGSRYVAGLLLVLTVVARPAPDGHDVLAQMPSVPGQTLTQLSDGRWLLAGGVVNGVPTSALWLFNAETQAFTLLDAVLANPRTGHTATALADGTVAVIGGTGPDG